MMSSMLLLPSKQVSLKPVQGIKQGLHAVTSPEPCASSHRQGLLRAKAASHYLSLETVGFQLQLTHRSRRYAREDSAHCEMNPQAHKDTRMRN